MGRGGRKGIWGTFQIHTQKNTHVPDSQRRYSTVGLPLVTHHIRASGLSWLFRTRKERDPGLPSSRAEWVLLEARRGGNLKRGQPGGLESILKEQRYRSQTQADPPDSYHNYRQPPTHPPRMGKLGESTKTISFSDQPYFKVRAFST